MDLRIPAFLYGTYDDARRAAGRAATAYSKGASLAEIAGSQCVRVADVPGLVVLDRKWSSLSKTDAMFHVDQITKQFNARAVRAKSTRPLDETLEEYGVACFEDAWAFLGFVAMEFYWPVRTAENQLRLLDAARRHWLVISALGARCTTGSNEGRPLQSFPTLVKFCLGRQGTPSADFDLPLTPTRLEELCAKLPGYRVKAALAAGDVQGALAEVRMQTSEIPLCSLAEHLVRAGYEDEACAAVVGCAREDPYGIVREWLAGRGDVNRRVR